jgi:hypothetical protein
MIHGMHTRQTIKHKLPQEGRLLLPVELGGSLCHPVLDFVQREVDALDSQVGWVRVHGGKRVVVGGNAERRSGGWIGVLDAAVAGLAHVIRPDQEHSPSSEESEEEPEHGSPDVPVSSARNAAQHHEHNGEVAAEHLQGEDEGGEVHLGRHEVVDDHCHRAVGTALPRITPRLNLGEPLLAGSLDRYGVSRVLLDLISHVGREALLPANACGRFVVGIYDKPFGRQFLSESESSFKISVEKPLAAGLARKKKPHFGLKLPLDSSGEDNRGAMLEANETIPSLSEFTAQSDFPRLWVHAEPDLQEPTRTLCYVEVLHLRRLRFSEFGPDACIRLLAKHLSGDFATGIDFCSSRALWVHVAAPSQALVQVLLIDARQGGDALTVVGGELFWHAPHLSDSLAAVNRFARNDS